MMQASYKVDIEGRGSEPNVTDGEKNMRKQAAVMSKGRKKLLLMGGIFLLFFMGFLLLLSGAFEEKQYAGTLKKPEDRQEKSLELAEDDYYNIYNEKDYIRFWRRVRNGEYDINGRLMADIYINDDASVSSWQEDGKNAVKKTVPNVFSYEGCFDGNGYTVYGLYSNDGNGLVGDNKGTIKNLTIRDAYVVGDSLSGGICSFNKGTIYNCSFYGIVECTLGEIGNTMGGICIFNEGIIERCSFGGEFREKEREMWNFEIAGICRHNDGEIKDCYNMTQMSAEDVDICYAISDGKQYNCYMQADSGWEKSKDGQVITLDGEQSKQIDDFVTQGLYGYWKYSRNDQNGQDVYVPEAEKKEGKKNESGLGTGLFVVHTEETEDKSVSSAALTDNDLFGQALREQENESVQKKILQDDRLSVFLWDYAADKDYDFSVCNIEGYEEAEGYRAEISLGRGFITVREYPAFMEGRKAEKPMLLWEKCAEALGEENPDSFGHTTYGIGGTECVILYDRLRPVEDDWEAGFFYLTPEKTYRIYGKGAEAVGTVETIRKNLEEGSTITHRTFLSAAFCAMKGGQELSDIYAWKDAAVKQAVYEAMSLEEGRMIEAESFFLIEELVIENGVRVTTFEDLVMCDRLKSLVIKGGTIEDIGFWEELTGLETLYLMECELSDISFVEKLPNLTDVSFYGNEITDISPLAACPEITVLSLAYNEIENIEALAGLSKLKNLSLDGNKITDISPLADLTQLQQLGLSDNQITDYAAIQEMDDLFSLNVCGNPGQDIGKKLLVPQLSVGPVRESENRESLRKMQEFLDRMLPDEDDVVEDICRADINGDGTEDIAMTVNYDSDKGTTAMCGERCVYVFLGKNDGTYYLADSVATYDPASGGMLGDPYQGIAIAGNKLIVQNYGGSAYRWLDTEIYEWNNGLREIYHMTLQNYLYEPGVYDYKVADVVNNTEKQYIIREDGEGDIEILPLFEEENPFYSYYDENGRLQLAFYYDEENQNAYGVSYKRWVQNGETIVSENTFKVSMFGTDFWQEVDNYRFLTYDGESGESYVDNYEEMITCLPDGKVASYVSMGDIDWLGDEPERQEILKFEYDYREDGSLRHRYQYANSWVFGTFLCIKDSYYDKRERLIYENAYVTHGSYDFYYIYQDEDDKPEYCLILDNNLDMIFGELIIYE